MCILGHTEENNINTVKSDQQLDLGFGAKPREYMSFIFFHISIFIFQPICISIKKTRKNGKRQKKRQKDYKKQNMTGGPRHAMDSRTHDLQTCVTTDGGVGRGAYANRRRRRRRVDEVRD